MEHIKYIVLILLKDSISTQELFCQARKKSGKKLLNPEVWADEKTPCEASKGLEGDHRQILTQVTGWVKEGITSELLICTADKNLFAWLGIGIGSKYGGLEVQTDFIEISSASE